MKLNSSQYSIHDVALISISECSSYKRRVTLHLSCVRRIVCNMAQCVRCSSVTKRLPLWSDSKGVINFPWIFFYGMQSLVPVGRFRNISWHLFTWLVCGSLQWSHGLLFTDCIVWEDKDKVIGFERSHWIHSGWWSTVNYQNIYTSPTDDWYLLQLTFHEIWH